MSLYRKKNSPNWHYDFQWQGARFYGSTGTPDKRLARQIEARARQDALLPSRARPPITLDEACGLYEDHARPLASWKDVERWLGTLISGLGGNRALADIGQRDLIAFVAKRRGAGLSNASVNRELENARAVWKRAAAARFDVGEGIDWGKLFLKVTRTRWRVLGSGPEQKAYLDAIRADVRDAARFLLLTGWRRNEVLGLTWSDCDFGARTAWTRIKGGDLIERPLTGEMIVILANQPRVEGVDQVFTYEAASTRGASRGGWRDRKRMKGLRYPLTATVLREAHEAARDAIGAPTLRIHDLRHTRGTRILRETGNLALAQRALGHRHIRTTLKYAHVLDEDLRDALERSENPAGDSRNIPEPDLAMRKKA